MLYNIFLYVIGEFLDVSLPSPCSQLYTVFPLARDQFSKPGSLETDKMKEKELRGIGRKKGNNELYSWCFLFLAIVSVSRKEILLLLVTQIKALENGGMLYVLKWITTWPWLISLYARNSIQGSADKDLHSAAVCHR